MAWPPLSTVFVSLISGMAISYAAFAHTSFFFDNSPAVEIHKQIVLTPKIGGDGLLKYRALYSKRPFCDVLGGAYEIDGRTATGTAVTLKDIQPRTYGTWPVGKDKETVSAVQLPPALPAGIYRTRWSYAYKCAGSFRSQTITSPWMAFEIATPGP